MDPKKKISIYKRTKADNTTRGVWTLCFVSPDTPALGPEVNTYMADLPLLFYSHFMMESILGCMYVRGGLTVGVTGARVSPGSSGDRVPSGDGASPMTSYFQSCQRRHVSSFAPPLRSSSSPSLYLYLRPSKKFKGRLLLTQAVSLSPQTGRIQFFQSSSALPGSCCSTHARKNAKRKRVKVGGLIVVGTGETEEHRVEWGREGRGWDGRKVRVR